MDYATASIALREKHGGLIETKLKVDVTTKDQLATVYSPGIAAPCRKISAEPSLSKTLTGRKNTVAVISDGSAVLGLGNIGPEAGLPVMEGKCMLLKAFGGVDGIPIVLDTQDSTEIIQTIKHLAPSFGGINLEDISAPRCFEIQAALQDLDIPVFHDDQDGTAMVVLAALINALKVIRKSKTDIRIVINGAGAAGIAIAKLLANWGVTNIDMVDSKGVIDCARPNLSAEKQTFCSLKNGKLADVMVGADVFIGVSKANLVSPEMVESMNNDPIIFALANPEPEIMPDLAKSAGAKIIATGRSDFPNQINNVLIFPGLFRGLLDKGVTKVTKNMKLNAAEALANLVTNPTADKIIPGPFDDGVAEAVANSVE